MNRATTVHHRSSDGRGACATGARPHRSRCWSGGATRRRRRLPRACDCWRGPARGGRRGGARREAVNGKWGHLLPGAPSLAAPPTVQELANPELLFKWRPAPLTLPVEARPERPSPTPQGRRPQVSSSHWTTAGSGSEPSRCCTASPTTGRTLGGGPGREAQLQVGNAVPPPARSWRRPSATSWILSVSVENGGRLVRRTSRVPEALDLITAHRERS